MVMYCGAYESTAAILQLLIDAGGDVNRKSVGQRPLRPVVLYNKPHKLSVLLAQPSLDLSIQFEGKTQNSMHVTMAGLHWRT